MSHFYNIFTCNNNRNDYFDLYYAKEFMLDINFVNSIQPDAKGGEFTEENNDVHEPINMDVFYPDMKDHLFWCIYVSIYGITAFKQIHRGYTNVMINEKQKIHDFFAENFRKMNAFNVRLTHKTIHEIMSDLMTNATVNEKLLYAFAIYYKKRIILTKGEMYIDIEPDDHDNKAIVIKKDEKYGLDTQPNVEDILKTGFKIEQYDKPLKSASHYKISELRELADFFGANITDMNKQMMYNELSQVLTW